MFTTLIVQPIFNLLVFIYAILPGHNFGLAIILFTVIVRLLMQPLVRKQLHQTRVMRSLQPELKRIKREAAGNRQKESVLMMELYKERGINPFASIGVVLLQLPIFIGLYSGLHRIVQDPNALVNFSYPFINNLGWMKQLAGNIGLFDSSLFGVVDLTRAAMSNGIIYWPAMLLVLGSAVGQFYQSKQLMPDSGDGRRLRDILKSAGNGQQADQAEVNAAVGRSTRFLFPAMIFFITLGIASALSLYWFISSAVAYIQQALILKEDETELESIADKSTKATKSRVIEGEVIRKSNKGKTSAKKAKQRRRR